MSDTVTQRALPWPFPTVRFGLPLLGLTVSSALFVLVAVQLETGFGGAGVGNFFANWLYDGVGLAAAFACFSRGLRDERARRLAADRAGGARLDGRRHLLDGGARRPSRIRRSRRSRTRAISGSTCPPSSASAYSSANGSFSSPPSVWLDGLGAGLTVCALAAGVVLNEVWRTSTGDFAAVATNMAYPAGDALLLGLVLAAFGFSGWRLDRTWAFLGGGLGLFALADSVYLVQIADGTYHVRERSISAGRLDSS